MYPAVELDSFTLPTAEHPGDLWGAFAPGANCALSCCMLGLPRRKTQAVPGCLKRR
jgi:hypothetical protein